MPQLAVHFHARIPLKWNTRQKVCMCNFYVEFRKVFERTVTTQRLYVLLTRNSATAEKPRDARC